MPRRLGHVRLVHSFGGLVTVIRLTRHLILYGKTGTILLDGNLIKPLKIGSVTLPNNLLLAPLAGYTDISFRRLCKDFGAGLTVTEMISVRGLNYGGEKTQSLLRLSQNETPSAVQLFGSDPGDFVAALSKKSLQNFDLVDINMGCPMPKVTKNGDGSALLADPRLAAAIVAACAALGRTVTVKVRLGIDGKENAVDFCRGLESAGAAAVTVHGRTAQQMYSGKADWDAIGNIAAKLKIPVIGNGDVLKENVGEKLSTYPVAGLMIGRGALGNPDIFSVLSGKEKTNLKEKMLKHIAYSLEYFPESYTVKTLRKHFVWYLKGVPDTKELKAALVKMTRAKDIIAALNAAL